ncbi:putative membrane protein [Leptospira sp. B5-022]|nr:putative membrane protein [Leptospira sp. B5-022]
MSIILFFLGWILSSVFVYFLFLRLKGPGRIGTVLLSVTAPLVWMGIVSFLLTMLGIYSIEKIILSLYIFFVLSAVCVFSLRKVEVRKSIRLEIRKYELVFLILFSLAALYLYAGFPTWYLDGGRDQGQYATFGIVISKTGGLNLEVPDTKLIREIFEDSVLVDYPSINSTYIKGLSNSETYRSPGFYHMLPAYLAIGYDLFEMEGLFRVNSIFAFLSIFYLYLISRRMLNSVESFFVLFLYVFNVAQLWTVRSTLSEILSQFIIFLVGYLIQLFFKYRSPLPMLWIGFILGISSFTRVDSCMYVPALALYSGFLLLFSEKNFKNSLYLFFAYLFSVLLSILYGSIYSTIYMIGLWERGFLRLSMIVWIASLIFVLVLVALKEKNNVLIEFRNFYSNKKRIIRIVFSLFLLFLGFFAFFFRPYLLSNLPEGKNATYLTNNSLSIFFWYVPIWLFVFVIFTFDHFIFKRKNIASCFVFFIGSFLLILYLIAPSISPDHFWATRRWVLFPIPFAILGSILGIRSILNKIRKQRKIVVFLILALSGLIYTIWRSKLILFHSMLFGYPEGYQKFVDSSPNEKAIYFSTKREIGSPLRYIYGKNIFLIRNMNEFINRVPKLLSTGFQVFIIQNGKFSGASSNLKFSYITDLSLTGKFPIESVYRFPEFLYKRNLNFQVFQVMRSETPVELEPIDITFNPSHDGFLSAIGKMEEDGSISAARHQGSLVYGPYLTLPKGKYMVEFIGHDLRRAEFDVVYKKGSYALCPRQTGDSEYSKILNFQIVTSVIDDIEFRVFVGGRSKVQIQKIRLKRIL